MALKALLDSLDGLPADVAKEYVKDEKSGKFRLSVEPVGGFELDDVSGLKSALGAARGELDTANSKLKEFGDISPNKAREGLAAMKKLEKLDPNADVDKIVQTKLDAQLEQIKSKHGEEVGKISKDRDRLRSIVEQQLIDSAAKQAILEAKGDPLLLLPHVKSSMKLKEKDDGSFSVEIVDDKGNPRIKDAQGALMGVADLVAEMRGHSSFARAFEATGVSGAGAQPPGQGGGAGQLRSKMSAADKAGFIDKHGYDAYMALPEG